MAKPFIKFPGGKRNHPVLGVLARLAASSNIDAYLELMLGGGAPFFALEEQGLLAGKHVILNDADAELIALYDALRISPKNVLDTALEAIKDMGLWETPSERRAEYVHQRALWNLGEKHPGRHLFLRHAVYNGLFRRSQSGNLNTPPRDRLENISIPALTDLDACARALQNAELLDWHFRQFEDEPEGPFIGPGTLVYADPPYDSTTGNGFVDYIAGGFDESDQRALIEVLAEWGARGATVVYSNADTLLIRALLETYWPGAKIETLNADRLIAADARKRIPAPEIVATQNGGV